VTTQLFIRVWENDLDWLAVCLQSIAKYWHDPDGLPIKIAATPECEGKIPYTPRLTIDPMYVAKDVTGQRRGSVYRAMVADIDTIGDLILFVDADSVFIRESRLEDFTYAGVDAPIIRCRKYEHLIAWDPSEYNKTKVYPEYRRAVEYSLGIDDPYHYMIGQPHLYYRDDVRGCRETIEAHCGMELHAVMQKFHENTFSEFTHFGAYVMHFGTGHQYIAVDGSDPIALTEHVRQYHSWSQKPADVKEELASFGLSLL
jgi:hypothetical protein